MNGKRIAVLIADGRAHARSAMRLLVAHEPGVVVVGEAATFDAALAAVATGRPDVVLMDWELPRGPTEECTDSAMDELRSASPESSVVVLSGLPEARQQALAAGADAFVSKGDPPETLLAAVLASPR